MTERILGKNIYGQPIFYGTAADLAAKTAILDALAEFWLPDGSRYQSNGAGGWNQTHAAGAALVTTYVPGIFTPFENDTAPTAAVEKLSIGDALELRIGLSNNDVDGTETVPATKNLFVSFNHASVLELDTPATRICIPYGKTATFAFSSTAPLTQFCYKIDAAPGAGAAVKISGGYTI